MKVTPIKSEQYLGDQLSKDRKPDTIWNIIRQFENQTQHDKDWIYSKARYETPEMTQKTSTSIKKWTRKPKGCTVSPHTTNT